MGNKREEKLKIPVRLSSILALKKAARLYVLFQKKKKKLLTAFFFLFLHSVISAEEERDGMKGTLDTLSFLVLPTKQRPPWPFGYCKNFQFCVLSRALISQRSPGPASECAHVWLTQILFFFIYLFIFILLCADRGVASQSRSRKAFIPDDCDSQNAVLTSEMGQISLGVFFFQHEQSVFFFFLSLVCIPNIINSPLFTPDESELVFL